MERRERVRFEGRQVAFDDRCCEVRDLLGVLGRRVVERVEELAVAGARRAACGGPGDVPELAFEFLYRNRRKVVGDRVVLDRLFFFFCEPVAVVFVGWRCRVQCLELFERLLRVLGLAAAQEAACRLACSARTRESLALPSTP